MIRLTNFVILTVCLMIMMICLLLEVRNLVLGGFFHANSTLLLFFFFCVISTPHFFSVIKEQYYIFHHLGTNTIAIMSGSESYASIKANFKDSWDEINKMIAHGKVSINYGQEVPVEICLGGDYKVRYEAVTWRKN